METDCIHFKDTGYFSKIILDYLAEKESLKAFYTYSPKLDSFAEAIEKKQFSQENRKTLVERLTDQYKIDKVKCGQELSANLSLLEQENTYTLTTGHQLCLFTGPLYFMYKIISVIKLARTLKEKYPKQNFVPIYWMATEDHDFAEINHFNFNDKRFEWETDQKGAVGRMKTEGLADVLQSFSNELTEYSSHAEKLKELFEKAYVKHENLAAATRSLVNELFGEYGIIIVDGDDAALKRIFCTNSRKGVVDRIFFSRSRGAEC